MLYGCRVPFSDEAAKSSKDTCDQTKSACSLIKLARPELGLQQNCGHSCMVSNLLCPYIRARADRKSPHIWATSGAKNVPSSQGWGEGEPFVSWDQLAGPEQRAQRVRGIHGLLASQQATKESKQQVEELFTP